MVYAFRASDDPSRALFRAFPIRVAASPEASRYANTLAYAKSSLYTEFTVYPKFSCKASRGRGAFLLLQSFGRTLLISGPLHDQATKALGARHAATNSDAGLHAVKMKRIFDRF